MTILTTDRLALRHFTLDDTEEIFRFSQEESLKKWIPNQVYASLDEARETLEFLISRYKNDEYPYVLAVETKEGVLVGHAGLSEIAGGIEIGYAIGEQFQRRGYAAEAVRAFAAWGKARFGLTEIYGVVKTGNAASIGVLEKAGFICRGTDTKGAFDKPDRRIIYVY